MVSPVTQPGHAPGREGRHEHDGDVGELDPDARRELGAVHLRHDDVAEDEIHRAVPAADEMERLGAVAGLEHGVPAVRELAPDHDAHALLIVDDEDDADWGAFEHGSLRGRGGRGEATPRPEPRKRRVRAPRCTVTATGSKVCSSASSSCP